MKNACLLLLLMAFVGLYAQPSDSLWQSAKGDLERATSGLEKGKAFHQMGKISYDRGNHLDALTYFKEGLLHLDSTQHQPMWAETIRDLGDCSQRLGDFEGAIRFYERVMPYYRESTGANDFAAIHAKMGYAYSNLGEFGKAMSLYEEGLLLYDNAEEVDSSGLAGLFITIGILHGKKGNNQDALAFYQKAEELYTQLEDGQRLLFVYNNMSGAYLQQANMPKALFYLQKSLKISEEIDYLVGMSSANTNIGMVYLTQKEYTKALPFFEEANVVASKIGDPMIQGNVNSNIGRTYEGLGDDTKALQYYQKSLEFRAGTGDQYAVARAKLVLAKLYLKSQQYDLAKPYIDQARELSENMEDQMGMADAYHTLGEMALAKKQFRQSVTWCQKALEIVKQVGAPEAISQNCKCLADAYQNVGDHRNALSYFKEYVSARDSVQNAIQTEEITRVEMRYEFEKEKELIEWEQKQKDVWVEAQLARQRLIGFILLGAIGSGLVILFLVWRSYRMKQKSNVILTAQKATIEAALADRENLLREIHHRVKNNLQVVSSLLSLQSRTIKDPAALDAIQEGRNRVKAMALIHKNLYQEENWVGVDLPRYIEKLTDSLVSSYQVNSSKINILREVDSITLDVDTLIPLGLILNELISNSLKYAFPDHEEGQIEVKINQDDAGLEIWVKDNGIGMPAGFEIDKTNTMGFKLVRAFAEKIKAKIEMISEQGTSIRIYTPHESY